MPLVSGRKLGPYEIVESLGAGGMGEVYRARDTRLERTVAIKVLASHLSATPELKQRFEREARAISALNHPHICHLYDVGSQDGIDYLVLEYLEGETLADRLRRGPMAISELLKTGEEVAAALQLAHRAAIVHRDLKPGNIMLTKSGAKLMDFGLAKPAALGAAASGSAPLLSAARTESGPSPLSPLTTAGSIVGTVQYMSPEQIEGKETDARCDIFALGAVLYEMATGKRAFEGKSQLTVASAILDKDPEPISAVKPLTPPALDHLIQRALAKDPQERWQTVSDIRAELHWIGESSSSAAASPAISGQQRRRERLAWMMVAFGLATAIVLAGIHFLQPSAPLSSIRAFIPAPENTSFIFVGDAAGPPVLSPDGEHLAFVATDASGTPQIYVRSLNALEANALAGTDNAWAPFWSPDGRKIGFFAESKLKIVDTQGGAAISIADAPNARGGAWSRDGTIVFAPDFRSSLYRVLASGGTAAPVTHIDESKHTSHRWPYFLPDGKHFLYLAVNHQAPRDENDGIYYASLDGKQNIRLKTAFTNPEFDLGSLLYVRDGELVAQAFDPSTGSLRGEEQRVAIGVTQDESTWRAVFTVSEGGLLAYSGGTDMPQSQLGWFDRTGKLSAALGEKFGNLAAGTPSLRLSPTGDRVALSIQGPTTDIWVMDVARGVRSRLTFGPRGNGSPTWSPDGKWIAHQTVTKQGNAIVRRLAAGGNEETLLSSAVFIFPTDWSKDGKYLLCQKGALGTHNEIWAVPLFGDRQPFQVVPSGAYTSAAGQLSPDEHWVAYQSNESGRMEVYIVPFRGNGAGGKWQASTSGGSVPRWRSDGKELFYLGLNGVLNAVSVTMKDAALKLAPAQPLFRPNSPFYDVAPRGQKFLFNVLGGQGSKSITLVTNWTADLKK